LGHYAVQLLAGDAGGLAVGIREGKLIHVPIREAVKDTREANGELMALLSTLS
jgi:6-phosphofructokinase